MKQTKTLILILITIICGSIFSSAQTGLLPADLNAAFGSFGTGISDIRQGIATDIVVQSTNQFAVNHSTSLTLHNPDGSQIATAQCPFFRCTNLERQGNNFLIWAGVTSLGELGITRLRPNLTVDTFFGNNGVVVTRIAGQARNEVVGIAIDGNRIIIAGNAGATSSPNDLRQFVARFKKKGNLDNTFGGANHSGYVYENTTNLRAGSVARQGTNIVVGGWSPDNNPLGTVSVITVYNGRGFRFGGFNNGNTLVLPGFGSIVAVQPNSKIIATIWESSPTPSFQNILTRINRNGTIDLSFGTNGRVAFDLLEFNDIWGVKLDQMERIILVGASASDTNLGDSRLAMARLNNSGGLDQTFANSIDFRYPSGLRIFDNVSTMRRIFFGVGVLQNGNIIAAADIPTNPRQHELYCFNGN